MVLLSVSGVSKHFGPEPVLAGVRCNVRGGEKVSLVGPNGAGKTTLLRILAGQEEADGGHVELRSSARLGYLQQQPDFDPARTVWEVAAEALIHLREMAAEAERLAQAMSRTDDEAQRQRLGRQFDRLHHDLERRDGYHLENKIERVLQGLGFDPPACDQPVGQLSGGQQSRLLMARLLLEEPDLMLLDEPSNHLDIDATRWLEGFLAASPSALIVVSHDRYFLDQVTTRTLELFQGTVESFPGNFTAYRRLKAERLEVQRRTFERQQAEIAKLKEFVRRHHYGQKHAQAEDRRKKLARIRVVPPPREIATPAMGFPPPARSGDVALRVEGLAKAFERPLFADLSFDILRGEKWGILGPNGCGKTTLLNCLLGRQSPDAGRVVWGANVQIGYFDQQLADLDDSLPVLDAVRPEHKEFVQSQRRDLLARFGITGDMVHQPVGSLSGGERNRAALARLAALDANFLVLDEPTNHLDLWSRGALERALASFEGSVLLVSHDRYFLNRAADHLLVVEPTRFRVVEGNYESYLHLVRRGLAQEAAPAPAGSDAANAAAPKKSSAAKPQRRKRRFPYRKVADLEVEIAAQEQRLADLHAALGSPEVLRDGPRVKQLKQDIQAQNDALATLYAHWEEALELNQ